MFEGFDEAMLRGAAFAIGGGVATVVLGILGWNVIQFVLARYGKGRNGNATPVPDTISITTTISDEFARFREEFKEEIREERDSFKDQIKLEREFTSSVNNRLWDHVKDKAAHAGGA